MNDDFENYLKSQPLRPVPPCWKEEILRAAREAAQPTPAKRHPAVSQWDCLLDQVHGLLWPSPAAWGALAVVWVLLLCLGVIPQAEEPIVRTGSLSTQQLELVRQQQAWVEEEFGAGTVAFLQLPPPRGASMHPGPRSEAAGTEEILKGALVVPRRETNIELV